MNGAKNMRTTQRSLFLLLAVAFAVILAFSAVSCAKKPTEPPKITTQYTVTYYDEDGTTLLDTKTFTHGDYLTFPTLTKTGYDVIWKLYDQNGSEVSNSGKVVDNLKAVANYQLMDCLVSVFDSSNDEKLYEQYHSYGDVYVPDMETEKPGYIFKGFTVDGEEYKTEFKLESSINIYAVYEAIPYTVTFFDDDTNRVIYAPSVTIYGDITLPVAPAKDGYTFDGWYVVDGFNVVRAGGKGESYLIDADTDFYAVYTKTEIADK